jgi:hypothetical protein
MNEAEFPSINLDELRLLPDWLREEGSPPSKQYAGHEGQADERPGDRRGGRFADRGGDRRDARRPGGGRPDGARGRPTSGGGGGGGFARGKNARRPERQDGDFRTPAGPAPAPTRPAPVRLEFQPDDRCLASIVKQIRSTHLAYPLFGLARMFLQEPERHWLQLTLEPEAVAAGVQLYQLGEEGPVTTDRQMLEKIAFDDTRERFYTGQTELKEPLKGNFTNVARERQSGTLLGPTNYHGYQPALRALYESRFSRRMSFEDYRRNIEIVTDPALVERWKEEARTVASIVTREGDPPTVLPNVAEARAHFRQHYFDGLVRSGTSFRVHGSVARKLPEPAMMQAIREAHERELRYPAQFVQLLRQGLQNAGLHIFKHRKRIVYVSLARPTAFVADGAVSPNVLAILDAIAGTPLITRKALAAKVLGRKAEPEAPAVASGQQTGETAAPPIGETETRVAASAEPPGDGDAVTVAGSEPPAPPAKEDPFARARAALAADVRFLVQAGHIIEFHNATFDLPLPPKAKEDSEPAGSGQAPVKDGAAEKPNAAPTHSEGEPASPRVEAIQEEAPQKVVEAATAPEDEPLAELSEPPQAATTEEPDDAAAEAIGLPGVAPAREEPGESLRHEPLPE